jgi:2-oxoglutarate ferredoxin oxidoreductase subunit beta
VKIGENGVTEKDLVVHDETSLFLSHILGAFERPYFPIPLGVLKKVKEPTFDDGVLDQIKMVRDKKGPGDMEKLLNSGDTWEVK